jgi:membrane-anchored protein YejM (alkaline phosphatase superfamily)
MKKISLFLLFIGLILSQIIVIRFNLNHGFVFHNVWIKILPIADYAGKSSEEMFLTSTILGYIAFIIFGVKLKNKSKYPQIFKSALMFTGIAVVVTFFEFTSILEDLNGTFQGKYFRIGWLLFLLGIWIFWKIYFSKSPVNR